MKEKMKAFSFFMVFTFVVNFIVWIPYFFCLLCHVSSNRYWYPLGIISIAAEIVAFIILGVWAYKNSVAKSDLKTVLIFYFLISIALSLVNSYFFEYLYAYSFFNFGVLSCDYFGLSSTALYLKFPFIIEYIAEDIIRVLFIIIGYACIRKR